MLFGLIPMHQFLIWELELLAARAQISHITVTWLEVCGKTSDDQISLVPWVTPVSCLQGSVSVPWLPNISSRLLCCAVAATCLRRILKWTMMQWVYACGTVVSSPLAERSDKTSSLDASHVCAYFKRMACPYLFCSSFMCSLYPSFLPRFVWSRPRATELRLTMSPLLMDTSFVCTGFPAHRTSHVHFSRDQTAPNPKICPDDILVTTLSPFSFPLPSLPHSFSFLLLPLSFPLSSPTLFSLPFPLPFFHPSSFRQHLASSRLSPARSPLLLHKLANQSS